MKPEDETFVEFVIAGEYEWEKKKRTPFIKMVANDHLTIEMLSPSQCKNTKVEAQQVFTKWLKPANHW